MPDNAIAISSENNLEFTPGPVWTVVPGEQFGQYWLEEAAAEQGTAAEGYEVSENEGHRRGEIAQKRDQANAHLMGMSPRLYWALKALYLDVADVGDDLNPEGDTEYGACRQAREVLLEVEKSLREDQNPPRYGLDLEFLEELTEVDFYGLQPVGISEDEWLVLVQAFNVLQSCIDTPNDLPALRRSMYGTAFLGLYELLVETTCRT